MSSIITELNILALPIFTLLAVWLTNLGNSKRDSRYFFTKDIMQKKFKAYENVYKGLLNANMAISNLFSQARTAKNKIQLKSNKNDIIVPILANMAILDSNRLFLEDKLCYHIALMLMIPADVLDLNPADKSYKKKLDKLDKQYTEDYDTAFKMITEYSGIKRVQLSLDKMNKPKITSNYEDSITMLKNRYDIKK